MRVSCMSSLTLASVLRTVRCCVRLVIHGCQSHLRLWKLQCGTGDTVVLLQDSVMPSQEPPVDEKSDGVDLPSEDTDGSRHTLPGPQPPAAPFLIACRGVCRNRAMQDVTSVPSGMGGAGSLPWWVLGCDVSIEDRHGNLSVRVSPSTNVGHPERLNCSAVAGVSSPVCCVERLSWIG